MYRLHKTSGSIQCRLELNIGLLDSYLKEAYNSIIYSPTFYREYFQKYRIWSYEGPILNVGNEALYMMETEL